MNNPRFPHKLQIVRTENTGTNWDPVFEDVVIHFSECRNYISTKSTEYNGVANSKYTVSLPIHNVSILAGDKIIVTDRVRTIIGEVVDSQIGNIGANIYYNEVKN